MKTKITTPTLLIAFNRPDTVERVFDYIRQAEPTKLYVALDGARIERDNEGLLCAEVRRITEQVDWDCEVKYKINDKNLGAEITVSEAIKWVFESEEDVIIIEDDIIVPLSFFKFAQEMLDKYRYDERISFISSNNSTPIPLPNNEDYCFAKHGHTYGWATWRRFWAKYDLNLKINDEYLKHKYLRTIVNTRQEARYFHKVFKRMKAKGCGNNSWDYILLYLHRTCETMAIIPRVNLSSNIGVYGLHSQGRSASHFREFDVGFVVKKEPREVVCNVKYDKNHFKKHILIFDGHKNNFIVRVLNKIRRGILRIVKR